MPCHNCRIEAKRFGKHRNGLQRFRCAQCGKTYTKPHERPLEGMTIPQEKALLALRLLVEGCSIRSIERTTELGVGGLAGSLGTGGVPVVVLGASAKLLKPVPAFEKVITALSNNQRTALEEVYHDRARVGNRSRARRQHGA